MKKHRLLYLLPLLLSIAVAGNAQQKPFPQSLSYAGCIKPNHVTQATMNTNVSAYYDYWKATHLKNNLSTLPGGYYVKGEITGSADGYTPLGSSEGQGYGMVITALMAGHDANAKTIYDGLFKTARAFKSSANANLMGWVVADATGAQGHFDSATDGDMDIAYSLILAHYQWGSAGTINYLEEAKKMITNGLKASNVTNNNRLNLGDWDTKTTYDTRPSDWMLSHMRAFYDVTGDVTWLNVINNLYSVYSGFTNTYSSSTGLVTDFIVGNPAQPCPANFLDEYPETNTWSYNACRFPLRIVMDYALYGGAGGKTAADKMATWIKGKSGGVPENIKDGYQLNGTATGTYATAVFVSPFIAAAVTNSANQAFVNSGWDWMKNKKEGYYSDSYNMLCMIFISGNWWKPGDVVNVPVTGVAVSPTSATINTGATQQLTATVSPSNATNKNVSWSSSNTAVATVNSSGVVTGVAAGNATITVTTQDGNKTATSAITVSSVNVRVTGVTISPTSATIAAGSTQQLVATVAPSNATNKNVSWSSSNTAVATVNSSGLVTGAAAGSATITVTTQDGNKTASSSITVTAPSSNLALNKTTVVSSTETAAYTGNLAVDGNATTRWSSAFSDPQYIYVDLNGTYNVNRVKITWEAALGKDYQVQIATSSGGPWTTMKTITGNTTLVNDHTGLTGSGRYVRINGTARATAYGYSIFELEVYGTTGPTNVAPIANAGADKTITLPTNSVVINGTGTDSDGTISTYAWSRVSGPNTPTLTNANTANLTASGLVSGTYVFRLTVTDNGGLTASDDVSVVVNPSGNVAPTANAGADKSITLPTNSVVINGTGTDSDGTISTYAWTRVSGPNTPTLTNANTTSLTASGLIAGTYVFRLTVTDNGGLTASDDVNVVVNAAPTSNIALNKPATVSSMEDATLPGSLAVDGNGTTRWASLESDAQWIYVNLGATYNVNRVKISWEAAYGKNYQIQIASASSGPWTTMKTITGNTTLVNDHTGLTGTGQFVRINCTLRGTAWGYSIFEFEVYGTSAARVVTTVDLSDDEEFTFFPNPAETSITITGKDRCVKIYNASGGEEVVPLSDNTINVSSLAKGVYTIIVRSGNRFVARRLIKK
jgi:endo-1,4-beta-D-glucanase Y